MTLRPFHAIAVTIFAVAACAPAAENDKQTQPEDSSVTDDVVMDANGDAVCPIIDSRNWHAWVDSMPGPEARPTLRVTGEVDMPTPGYSFEWREGAADRSATPVQRLQLTATAPDGMSAQVITTETVRYEGPAISKAYRGIMVVCGGEVLADIPDVTVAE